DSQFLVNQVAVVTRAYFGRGQAIGACIVHVAQELDGIVGTFGQFSDIETQAVQFLSFASQPPTGEVSAAALQCVICVLQQGREDLIVAAVFEQLCVGVFQQL